MLPGADAKASMATVSPEEDCTVFRIDWYNNGGGTHQMRLWFPRLQWTCLVRPMPYRDADGCWVNTPQAIAAWDGVSPLMLETACAPGNFVLLEPEKHWVEVKVTSLVDGPGETNLSIIMDGADADEVFAGFLSAREHQAFKELVAGVTAFMH